MGNSPSRPAWDSSAIANKLDELSDDMLDELKTLKGASSHTSRADDSDSETEAEKNALKIPQELGELAKRIRRGGLDEQAKKSIFNRLKEHKEILEKANIKIVGKNTMIHEAELGSLL